VGARSTNGTLKLSADDQGLFVDAQIGAYSWAKDLRLALERGDINQGSIALTVGDDSWEVNDSDEVLRTVLQAEDLYDVTVTAQGAFPQTNLAVAYSLVRAAVADGRLPEKVGAALVAPEEGEPPSQQGGEEAVINPKAEELQHRFAVRRDEIAALIERVSKL
jgi:hypothetical protein